MVQYFGLDTRAKAINVHKISNICLHFFLLFWFGNSDNVLCLMHCVMYCVYATLWITTTYTVRIRSFQNETSYAQGLQKFGHLTCHYILPVYMNYYTPKVNNLWIGGGLAVYLYGLFIWSNADTHKHYALTHAPKGFLITNDLFAYAIHINYFGELLLYFGLSLLTGNIFVAILYNAYMVYGWTGLHARKERSLSRYPEWAEYAGKTSRFIPFIY